MAALAFNTDLSKRRIDRIIELLNETPMTVHDLAERLPLSRRWVTEYLKHLRSLNKVYVTDWTKHIEQRKKRHAVEIWALGDKKDKPKPPPDGQYTRYKRAWNAVKSDPDRHEQHLARRRVKRRLKNLKPDPATAWIPRNEQNQSHV